MREFKMENETTIEVGETYRFADLWSGNGDEAEIELRTCKGSDLVN